MKRLISIIIMLSMILILGACTKKPQAGPEASPTTSIEVSQNTAANTEPSQASPTSNPLPVEAKALEASDFSISDGKNIISLYTNFMDLKLDKKEIEIENNYVGENTVDGYTYKYFIHQYDDFDLYVSNANYNLKGKDFDDRYITQISLKNKSDFKTPRGIAIGSTLTDVQNAYGQSAIKTEEGNNYIEYLFEDMVLKFALDNNNVVTGISVDIIVKGNE